MPNTSSSTSLPRFISAIATFSAVALAGLVIGLVPRGEMAVQASSQSTVPTNVHIGNASGKGGSCKANNITHIFLTITDIQAHQSGKGTAGFHDLTPGIPAGGVQVDLLDNETEGSEMLDDPNQCILTDVSGGTSGLPPGKYQQFRLSLLTNGTSSGGPANNACASLGANVFNCVVSNDTLAPLTVPSGSVKIPSSQISHGGLTISANQGGVDLDIDINACASLVVRGGGSGHGRGHHGGGTTFALKPVLHSGEISLNPLISGDVVVGAVSSGAVTAASPATGVSGATVLLEQRGGINNFIEGTPAPAASPSPSVELESVAGTATTDSNGHFVFCPVPVGTYDIVAGSGSTSPNASDATITTSVTVAKNGGPNGLVIPLLSGSSPAVTLNAQLTSQNGSPTPAATPAIIDFGAAQTVTTGIEAQIPLYSGTSTSPATTSGGVQGCTCPTHTDCACVNLVAPEDNPVIGAAGGPYATPAPSPAYSVFGTTTTCNPTNLITVPEASPLPTPTLSFVNCL